MVPEDLLFWIAPLTDAPTTDPNVLCRRHADAMVVPRGWTLDDRREAQPRLFKPRQPAGASSMTIAAPAPASRRRRSRHDVDGEQLQIDGTGEIERPNAGSDILADASEIEPDADVVTPWQPEFDADDDLDGLLEVSSPLLARAFRGTDRRR